jgi:hypothetical protein
MDLKTADTVAEQILNPEPPFVWPDARILSKGSQYQLGHPMCGILGDAAGLVGILADPGASAVAWLSGLLSEREQVKATLIVALYPACRTTTDDLARLLELQRSFDGRLELRLLLHDAPSQIGADAVCVSSASDGVPVLLLGRPMPFHDSESVVGQLGLAVDARATLRETWRNWFDWTWWHAVPLDDVSAAMPRLVPAKGSPEGSRMWADYVAGCKSRAEDTASETSASLVVDPSTGRVELTGAGTAPEESPSAALGTDREDAALLTAAALCERGDLVVLNRASGAGPLDAAMKPHWFGDQASIQHGSVSRKVAYRVSLLDKDTLRLLENRRKDPRALIEALSYGLADNVRWMPRAAQPLFERELQRLNDEGLDALRKAVGPNVEDFARRRAEAVVADANAIVRQAGGQREIAQAHADEMISELQDRMATILTGRYLPTTAYAAFAIRTERTSASVSPAGQAVALLHAIAKYPRVSIRDAQYYLRGLHLDAPEVQKAMDVFGDAILQVTTDGWQRRERVLDELVLLECVKRAGPPVTDEAKCKAIIELMRGADCVKIGAQLVSDASGDDENIRSKLTDAQLGHGPARLKIAALFELLPLATCAERVETENGRPGEGGHQTQLPI